MAKDLDVASQDDWIQSQHKFVKMQGIVCAVLAVATTFSFPIYGIVCLNLQRIVKGYAHCNDSDQYRDLEAL